MTLTANAEAVLERRYLARDERGVVVETPAQLFERVAATVAEADARYGADDAAVAATARRFYERMSALEFLPNSPTLMNAGRALGQLAACFVVPVADATDAIFDAVRWAALIQKTGGGTGFSFSRLRPAGDVVESTNGTASGPVSFMQVFDVATEAVKQGGTRRGANMGILRVDHPDILDFIAAKLEPGRMRNFNLSVAITDEFMAALAAGDDYALVNPRSGQVVRRLSAERVFELVVHSAWATGDPGLVFLDRINASQPTPELGEIEATNPCGEQPLLPFESCTLGSLHLARFSAGGQVDWARLREAVRDAVHFLDNVIDVNRYPLPQIEAATRATRKIGLGVMGLADLLADLGIPYDSERAVALGGDIAAFLESESLAASVELARVRGPFPAYHASRWAKGKLDDGEHGAGGPLRNATTTTVAPTGTISIIAGCSSGIEPFYALAYRRHVLDGEVLEEVHPSFRQALQDRGLWSDELGQRLAERGSARGMDEIPADLQALYPTAHDIPVEDHVRMQAAFQRHAHAAVSKTINLAHDAPPSEVARAFRLAYDLGCKGVTIFRDGSKGEQVLAFGARAAQVAAPPACPECERSLAATGSCRVCTACGWSACG